MKNLFIIALIAGLVYWFKIRKTTDTAEATETEESTLKSAWLLSSSDDSPLANSNPTADGSGSGTSDAGTSTTTSGTRPNTTVTGTTSATTSGTTSGGSGARRLTPGFTWNTKSKSAFR